VNKDVDFVKHYQAHLKPINALVLSPDGKQLVTTSEDRMVKFFDVESFDMSSMIQCDFEPTCVQWLPSGRSNSLFTRIVVGDADSGALRVYSTTGEMVKQLDVHRAPVVCLALNPSAGVVVSADRKGMLEYLSTSTLGFPDDQVSFKFKGETDLYDLAKAKTLPFHISFSPDGGLFSVMCEDMQVRLFKFREGKLYRKYDESPAGYADGKVSTGSLDDKAVDARLTAEKGLSGSKAMTLMQSAFDETGNFLVFPSLCGIKVLNLVTNKVVRTLGQAETGLRFLALALYQGVPKVDAQYLLAKKKAEAGDKAATQSGAATVDEMKDGAAKDPTLFCTAFGKKRFYCFSSRVAKDQEDEEQVGGGIGLNGRDVLNEAPDAADLRAAGGGKKGGKEVEKASLPTKVVLRSSMGDIHMKLFPEECPRTVENFTTHARNRYYNGVVFHRIIKGFMCQTGDPLGTGTGGNSIWGRPFEDEIHRSLRHDRPFTVSMANSGPGTNGSQFFITCAATPWLDGKHTVFGRVTKGLEVVSSIEDTPVDKGDKPLKPIKILSIDIVS
jgi:peptidylprolyl isomerase domain and WD repeat-containing protein 1